MKICFVFEYYFPHIGGAETIFKNLTERLVRHGHSCVVVTSRLPNAKKYEKINGVDVYRVTLPKFLCRYWFTFLSIPAIYSVAKDCDVIQTTTYNGAFPAFFVSKLLRKPAVITILELYLGLWKTQSGFNWLNARLHLLMEMVSATLSFDKYVCISYHTRNCARMCGIDDKRLLMIYPAVDYNLFSYQKDGANLIRKRLGLENNFVYLYFGRPGYFKGVEHLVRAVNMISRKIPNATLMLILSKEPKGRYEKILFMIKALKIEGSVKLLENMPEKELVAHISTSDCVVVPSLSEGFGLSCLEACVVGKPVVAADVGAIPEIIFGKYVLVAPGSPEAICDGVYKAYLGKTEFQPRKTFDWDGCLSKYEAAYEDIIGEIA